MSSDNHAHFARIGLTVVVGVIAIVATLVYLGGFIDRSSEFLIETYYDYPVTGLSVGSPVNLFGVKVGEVREISFADSTYYANGAGEGDMRRVCIVMALSRRVLGIGDGEDGEFRELLDRNIKRGLRATVTANGVTGLARVEIRVVENPPPVAELGWVPRYPLVPPSPSLLDSFSVAATKFMNRLKETDFASVWSNVQVTAESAARLAVTADMLLESERSRLAGISRDVAESTGYISELARSLRENPSLLLRPADPEPLPETKR